MATLGQNIRRRIGRAAAALTVLAVVVLTASGCHPSFSYRYPHACDGYGGIVEVWKGFYVCTDGRMVGGGWLALHPDDPRARP